MFTMRTEVTGKREMNAFEAIAASTGEFARVLNHHYEDGTVYVPSGGYLARGSARNALTTCDVL